MCVEPGANGSVTDNTGTGPFCFWSVCVQVAFSVETRWCVTSTTPAWADLLNNSQQSRVRRCPRDLPASANRTNVCMCERLLALPYPLRSRLCHLDLYWRLYLPGTPQEPQTPCTRHTKKTSPLVFVLFFNIWILWILPHLPLCPPNNFAISSQRSWVLEEDEEDEYHLWYWWKGIGSGRSSPDSRWRRFIIATAVRKSDRSFIGAFLPDLFSEIFPLSKISLTPLRMGSRSGLPVPIYPLRCTSPRSSQFRVANHDILDLVGNNREFHQILFDTSLPRVVVLKMLFLCLNFAVPSTTRSPHSDDVVRDWESIQSPLVKMLAGFAFNKEMSTSAIDHSLIPIKKAFWALHLELFRITRTTLHCPFHESSLSNRHWMGCRRYFAANRLEVLLDEDDSRSSSRVREHGRFLLVSQLHMAIQTLWSQCPIPRAVWTNRRIVHF